MTHVITLLFHIAWMLPTLMLLVFVTERLLRSHMADRVHKLWLCTLPATLGLSLVASYLHPFSRSVQSVRVQAGRTVQTVTVDTGSGNLPSLLFMPHAMAVALLSVVALCFAVAAFRLWFSLHSLSRLRRQAERLAAPQRLVSIAASLSIPTPDLFHSEEVVAPIALGVRHPAIFLPRDFSVQPAEWSATLAHECAHIRRGDYATNLAVRTLALFFAWHPATPLLLRMITASREIATDQLAATTLGDAPAYAAALLQLWKQLASPQYAHAVGIFDANILKERIMQITRKPAPLATWRKAAAVAACIPFFAITAYAANAMRVEVQQPLGVTTQDTSRKVVAKAMPVWSPEMKATLGKDFDTIISLRAKVDSTGKVVNLNRLPGGNDLLVNSCIEAAQHWQYEPGPAFETIITFHFSHRP